jgi:hypothetical protein
MQQSFSKHLCPLIVVGISFFAANSLCIAAPRPEVLIYYANETAPDTREAENYAKVFDFLRPLDLPKAKKIVERFDEDLKKFPEVVHAELSDMKEGLTNSQSKVCVAAFTNRSVREGYFFQACGGDSDWKKAAVGPVPDENFILRSNPNSNPAMLERALLATAALFDPNKYDFIFVGKSHGTAAMAIVPALRLRFEDADQKEILNTLASQSKKSQEVDNPPEVKRVGVSKDLYYEAFENAGSRGMNFPLVFSESCFSSLPGDKNDWRLPANVETLYASVGSYAQYQTLDYKKLLSETNAEHSLKSLVERDLAKTFSKIEPRTQYWKILLGLGLVGILFSAMNVVRSRGGRSF